MMFNRMLKYRYFNQIARRNLVKYQNNQKINNQEDTLIDTFGRHHNYLRISLTERCNLRCSYCMPEEGVNLTENSKLLTTNEIIHLSKIFVNNGVDKIRLTGGEPTIRKDLAEIIARLKGIEGLKSVSITTNGLVLLKKLVQLQRAGLDVLNISLDTLNPDKYTQITRRKGLERVLMGIDLALQLGFAPVKLNCVVMKGFNDEEIKDFVELTKNKNLDVRFIEYMPFSGNKWDVAKMIPYSEMISNIKEIHPDFQKLKDDPNSTSKGWKIPGYKGRVGFITSMSEHFCGSCNRLRITADGNLKVCLFGNKEVSLRDALRNGSNDVELSNLIGLAVKNKKKQHAAFYTNSVHTSLFFPHLLSKSNETFIRNYSTKKLTHVNEHGKADMVDVSPKPITTRTATAKATVMVGPEIKKLIKENSLKKGDVLSIAQIAGILAAKKTSEIIPLCHNIPLGSIKVKAGLDEQNNTVSIEATVKCEGKTGCEMEALTAVTVAALNVYDMCKSISKNIEIQEVKLLRKSGGQSGDHNNEPEILIKSYENIHVTERTVFVGGI